uniref:Uncharacterized protein n=1 Tax=Oryza sativa subsp. japonica TaxID=39947 RepID=Q6H3Z8_ORYSJ|nr:hypothetical protein [Oryza sativa Japonica Group]BAD26551.1 hypothetical protein [Oryza sativa Japonica Group]
MFGGLDSPEPTRARAMVFARVSERAATASSSRRDERRDPVVGFGFNEWRGGDEGGAVGQEDDSFDRQGVWIGGL